MKYRVRHTTRYDYSETVPICYNRAHLTPRRFLNQDVEHCRIQVGPAAALMGKPRTDYFGNDVTYFTVQEPHHSLSIVMEAAVAVVARPAPANPSPAWDTVHETLRRAPTPDALDAYQYVFESRFVQPMPILRTYALPSFLPGRPLVDAVLELTKRIHLDFAYDPVATTVSTPLEQVVQNRRGVCQDFAHLEIGCLRSLGMAARYVSGYIYGGESHGRRGLTGAQASHAWVSVFCPANGWVDFDPTNNMMPTDQHITLAWGRDYDDVSPVRGIVLGGGEHTIQVDVAVERDRGDAG